MEEINFDDMADYFAKVAALSAELASLRAERDRYKEACEFMVRALSVEDIFEEGEIQTPIKLTLLGIRDELRRRTEGK